MIPTVKLYGERGTAIVNEDDAQAWLDAGWRLEPFPPAPEPKKQTPDQTPDQTPGGGSRKSGGK